MKIQNARANNLFLGHYNTLYIVGATRAANGASDFTAAATTQVITLESLGLGDGADYPLARVFCAIAPAGTGLTNVQIKVGHTDDDDAFIAQTALIVQGNSLAAIGPAAAGGGPLAVTAASKALTATFDTTGANLSALTAGEYWIYCNVVRKNQYLQLNA